MNLNGQTGTFASLQARTTASGGTPRLILADAARQFLNFDRPDLARALSDIALSDDPNDSDALSLAANILDREARWSDSLEKLQRAHTLAPQAAQVRLNLAMALLRLGQHREGFAHYEARLEKQGWSGFATPESRAALRHRLLRPGESVEGKRIVVLAEQGLGDGIMFARYLPMLVERGARVFVACNPTLRHFFARMAGVESVLAPPADQPLAQINLAALAFDAWVPLLSLAHWFATDAASIPAAIPYWTPTPQRVAHWRRELNRMGRPGNTRVGLVFQANPDGAGFRDKSTVTDEIAPLCALEGIDIINLQHGAAGRDLAKAVPWVVDPVPAQLPLDEYAAVVAATDLLISVDTMAAHCAGAMGHPVWIAVPHSPHWAWGLEGEATPWYPTMRVFRQAQRRDWSATIASLAAQLRARFPAPLVVPDLRGLAAFNLEMPSAQTLDSLARPIVASPAAEVAATPASPPLRRADKFPDAQAARALSGTAQALRSCGRGDLAQSVVALRSGLNEAGRNGHEATSDALDGSPHHAALSVRQEAAASGTAEARFQLACAQLLQGNLDQGFADYEARRQLPRWFEQALPAPGSLAALEERVLKPGDPLNGRRIVVFTEQGLGDTFFGTRFLALLAERGARITLVCRAPMRPFFARLSCLDAILSPPPEQPGAKINLARLEFDAVCPLLSLPFALGIARVDDVAKSPYLSVDPAQTAAWRERFARAGRAGARRVGLVFRANPSNQMLAKRSLDIEDLAPLVELDQIDWVNLQDGAAGRALPAALPNVIDATREPLPLDEFAAALSATDLVVSVDTMAAHCAGALHHPVLVALPSEPAWYWGAEGVDCAWYPTARLFRRGTEGSLRDVMAKVAAVLSEASFNEPSCPQDLSKQDVDGRDKPGHDS